MVSNDEISHVESYITQLDIHKITEPQAIKLRLMLDVLGGGLRSYTVGQSVLVRVHQDMPI